VTDIQKPCTKREAQQLTDRIRQSVDNLWLLLTEAHDRRAWKALGYTTWAEYVAAEFAMGRQRSYQILDQGRVIEAIRGVAVVSTAGRQNDLRGATRTLSNPAVGIEVSEKAAREIKDSLPEVISDIRDRLDAGQDAKQAVADAVAAKREEKARLKAARAAQQAEWDRQREESRRKLAESNPAIAAAEAAKHANGARNAAVPGDQKEEAQKPEAPKQLTPKEIDAIIAERDELREENAALRDDVARLTAQMTKFDEMVAQYERGGFEAIIATKDQRIQGLLREVEDVTADRASLARSRDHWRKTAIDLGYVSPNSRIIEAAPDDAPTYDISEEVGF
jgi:hypothetical protein